MRGGHAAPLVFVLAGLFATCAAHAQPASAPAADLELPAWTYCEVPLEGAARGATERRAAFDFRGVQQLLRLQEHARYALRLGELHTQLDARMQELQQALEAALRDYQAIQDLNGRRVALLRTELTEAREEGSRWQRRAERHRVWPWVALGAGVVLGAGATAAITAGR